MALSGQLLRILSAATVWVAVLFVPAVAEAHVGHVYGHSRSVEARGVPGAAIHTVAIHTVVAKTERAHEAVPKAAPAPVAGQIQRVSGPKLFMAASRDLATTAADPNGCVDGCCGDGMICCGAAFSAGIPDLTPVARSIRVRLTIPVHVRGIEPDALRKPPRAFV